MFDYFDNCLKSQYFIFIKYFSLELKTKTDLNPSLSEELDNISVNKKQLILSSSTNLESMMSSDMNAASILSHNTSKEKIEIKMKNLIYKRLNLRKNLFFYEVKFYFFSRMKSFLLINSNNYNKNLPIEKVLITNFNSSKEKIGVEKTKTNANEQKLIVINKSHEAANEDQINKKIMDENFVKNEKFENFGRNNLYIKLNSKENFCSDNNDNCDLNLDSIITNKNSQFLEQVLDKIQYKKKAKQEALDLNNLYEHTENEENLTRDIIYRSKPKKQKSSKKKLKNLMSSTKSLEKNSLENENKKLYDSTNMQDNCIPCVNSNNNVNNNNNNLQICNSSIKITLEKSKDFYENMNRCSSIKEKSNVSASQISLMKEIKDINVEIENKNKKLETFIENKSHLQKLIDANISNVNQNSNLGSLNQHNAEKPPTGHQHKVWDFNNFNINDVNINLNLSKADELKICKNGRISLLESSIISAIKKDSPEHFVPNGNTDSNKNILQNIQANNELEILASSNNNYNYTNTNNDRNPHKIYAMENQKIVNFVGSDKSLIKNELYEKTHKSQNFCFSITYTSPDISCQDNNFNYNNNPNSNNIKLKTQFHRANNDSYDYDAAMEISYNKCNNKSHRNEFLLAQEKVKQFSLISDDNSHNINKQKSNINSKENTFDKSKNSRNSRDRSKNYCKKNSKNNNDSIILVENNSMKSKHLNRSKYSDQSCYAKNKSLKEKNGKGIIVHGKYAKILNNGSFVNTTNEYKTNNIMKIRKIRRMNSKKDVTEKNKLIKIKDFEEIMVDNFNKSFEEKPENCSVFNKFFGLFNVFKCGTNPK